MKKLVFLFVCIILILGITSCNNKSTSAYDGIIETYTSFLTLKQNGEALPEAKDETESLLARIADECEDPTMCGYAVKDIDLDGKKELVLMRKDSKILALFTEKDGKPVLLLDVIGSAAISPDGTVYYYEYDKDKGSTTQIKIISDGALAGYEHGFDAATETFYKIEAGVRTEITRDELIDLDTMFTKTVNDFKYITKTAGLRFIGAIPEENTSPAADFSSYDAILSSFKTMVEAYPDFTKGNWVRGDFDTLFSYENDSDYYTFNSLFSAGASFMPTSTRYGNEFAKDGEKDYGYSIKDLDGDGTDELILLTAKYDIIAIFTQKDGCPHLLDSYYNQRYAYIDEAGLIHVKKETGGLTSRDAECYLYSVGKGKLECRFGIGYKVNIYLEKEGFYKTDGKSSEPLTKAEWEALDKEYSIKPYDYSYTEYTKTHANLAFISLFDPPALSNEYAGRYTNSQYIAGDTLTLSDISDTSLSFSFYSVTRKDTSLDSEILTSTDVGTATKLNGVYMIESDTVKGHITLGVGHIWLNVTESTDKAIEARCYLFDVKESK